MAEHILTIKGNTDEDYFWSDPTIDADWWPEEDYYANSWDDDDWPELTPQMLQDEDDWYREMREDQLFDIQLSQNVPWSKVRGFIEDAKGWKSYDTKNGGRNKREPDRKKFAHWHGFVVEMNNIERIIASMAKPYATSSDIVKKIKANPKYKHCAIYRAAAGYTISDLQNPDIWWWNHNKRLRKFDPISGQVWLKSESQKYLGEHYD